MRIMDKVLLKKNAENDYVLGKPYIEGASIKASVVKEFKDKKVVVFKSEEPVTSRKQREDNR